MKLFRNTTLDQVLGGGFLLTAYCYLYIAIGSQICQKWYFLGYILLDRFGEVVISTKETNGLKCVWPYWATRLSAMHWMDPNSKYFSLKIMKNQMETKNCSHKPRQYSMLWISQSDCIKKTPLPYKWHLHCDVVQGLASQQLHLASWHPIYPTSCSHPALAPFIQTPWVIHPIFIQDRKVGVIKPENQVFGAKFTRLACLLKALRVYFLGDGFT